MPHYLCMQVSLPDTADATAPRPDTRDWMARFEAIARAFQGLVRPGSGVRVSPFRTSTFCQS